MTPGQIAYEAYVRAVGGRSVAGDILPGWGDQDARIREAWEVAADAVRRADQRDGNPGGGDPIVIPPNTPAPY